MFKGLEVPFPKFQQNGSAASLFVDTGIYFPVKVTEGWTQRGEGRKMIGIKAPGA